MIPASRLSLNQATVKHLTLLGFAAAVCVVVGFTVFLGAWPRVFLSLVMLAALVDWVVFQNFGGISTGASTDVGTGPVLILLACAFWPLRAVRARQAEDAPAAAGGVNTAGWPVAARARAGSHRPGAARMGAAVWRGRYSGSW